MGSQELERETELKYLRSSCNGLQNEEQVCTDSLHVAVSLFVEILCTEPFDETSDLNIGPSPLVVRVGITAVIECKRGFLAVYSIGGKELEKESELSVLGANCELEQGAVTAQYTRRIKDFTCEGKAFAQNCLH